jgi:hypothetical protein
MCSWTQIDLAASERGGPSEQEGMVNPNGSMAVVESTAPAPTATHRKSALQICRISIESTSARLDESGDSKRN